MKLNLAQLRRVSALSEKDPETLATMVVELEVQLDIARALTSEIQKDLTKMRSIPGAPE